MIAEEDDEALMLLAMERAESSSEAIIPASNMRNRNNAPALPPNDVVDLSGTFGDILARRMYRIC